MKLNPRENVKSPMGTGVNETNKKRLQAILLGFVFGGFIDWLLVFCCVYFN